MLATIPGLGTSSGSRFRGRPKATVILTAVLSLAVAGCGGSSRPTPQPTRATVTTATTTPTSPPPVTGGRPVSAGALRATLSGENHTPMVNQPWRYSVKLTNATG